MVDHLSSDEMEQNSHLQDMEGYASVLYSSPRPKPYDGSPSSLFEAQQALL
jgi:hypothetical protein